MNRNNIPHIVQKDVITVVICNRDMFYTHILSMSDVTIGENRISCLSSNHFLFAWSLTPKTLNVKTLPLPYKMAGPTGNSMITNIKDKLNITPNPRK